MKFQKIVILPICILLVTFSGFGQKTKFQCSNTPASKVFQDFIKAYNSGSRPEIESFVRTHYANVDTKKLSETTEYWMDLYYRYGSIAPHSLSINKPFDLEVWVQGTISKTWFAPEFILNKDTKKIRAVGLLQGDQPPNTSTPAKSQKEFLARIDTYLLANEAAGLFQGTILIQRYNRTVLKRAFGLKNIKTKEKNVVNTRMRMASVTKPVTAIAVLQLVQKGLLDLEKPISTYLPDFPKHIADKITVSQLLTHTSGYELDGIDGFRKELKSTNSISEVYATQLKNLPKWKDYNNFDSPRKFNYSNDDYDLLAVILEKVSGTTFPEYLKKNVFDVAQMPDTSFSNTGIATPYRYDIAAGGLKDYESKSSSGVGQISGAATLKTTVSDLKNLFNTIKNTNKLLDLPHRGLFLGPRTKIGGSAYQSLGLRIYNKPILSLGHSGTNIGNTSELWYFPDSDYLLVVLCNNRSGAPNLFNFFKNNIPTSK